MSEEARKLKKYIDPTVKAVARVAFGGSFQCRLATENDFTTHQPTDPEGKYGTLSKGWTFRYRELAFDRVIRLSQPVQLRNALVDPWEDVVVESVEVDKGWGLVKVADPLLGKPVSLGLAKFDSKLAKHVGGGREALADFSFSIGGSLLRAGGDPPPLCKAYGADTKAWGTEYKSRKPGLAQAAPMDPVRKEYLFADKYGTGEPGGVGGCSLFFEGQADFVGRLTNVFCDPQIRLLSELRNPQRYEWMLDMTFYRFDGDTLVGRMSGQLYVSQLI